MDRTHLTALVKKAQSGNTPALNELMTEFYQPLHYCILKYTQNEDVAWDITQESCIAIMTQLPQLRAPEAFPTWAYTIARNLVYKHQGQAAKEVPLTPLEDDETILDSLPDENPGSLPEQVYEDKEFQQTMQDMLDKLPGEQRVALMLYYYEKLPVRDIAAIQGTTEGTVKSRLNYGRKAVRQQVEDYEKKNNVKLHSVAMLPLMYYLFGKSAEESAKATAVVIPAVAASAVTASAVTASAATAGGALAAKIAGIVLAVALVGGAVAGVVSLTQPEEDDSGDHTLQEDEGDEDEEEEKTDPTESSEQDVTEENHLAFRLNDDGESYCVVGLDGDWYIEHLEIPGTYNGLPVTHIGEAAFSNCRGLQTVNLPEGLETIGDRAFSDCFGLQTVNLPEGLETIGESAFSNCFGLQTVNLPAGLKTFGDNAFRCSGLQAINLPAGLETIGEGAFADCDNLQTINLPAGLETIGEEAFADCDNLQTINLPEGLKTIGDSAFSDCVRLQAINLPEGLETIGDSAFSDCRGLQTINLPAGLETIGEGAFADCDNLQTINLPAGLKTIGGNAFELCSQLQAINLPEGLETIGQSAFAFCSQLQAINLPEGLKTIGAWAFQSTGLVNLVIPEGITVIEPGTFADCNELESIVFPSTLERIADGGYDEYGSTMLFGAFYNCPSLKKIVIPGNVKYIGTYAFNECMGLEEIVLEEGVERIMEGAFEDGPSLMGPVLKMYIPASIVEIHPDTFAWWVSNQYEIFYAGTMEQWYTLMPDVLIRAHCADGIAHTS